MTTLDVTTDTDYSGDNLKGVTQIDFDNTTTANATFAASQFDAVQVSNFVHIVVNNGSSDPSNFITITMTSPTTFSAANWTVSNWRQGSVFFIGSSGVDHITGSPVTNHFNVTAGDVLTGGAGGNIFEIDDPSQIGAGGQIIGGAGQDELDLYNSGTFDFTQITMSSIDSVYFSGADQTAVFTSSEFANVSFVLASDSNIDVIGNSINLSSVTSTIGTVSFTLTGTSGNDTLTGSSLNDILIGGGGNDSLDGLAGANTVDYSGLTTAGLSIIVQGGGGTVNKGGTNGTDSLTKVQTIVDTGTGRGNGDVFEIDATEHVAANSANFNYLIELSAGVNLAYVTNFTGISEFVSNTGTNIVNFAADTAIAYLFGSTGNDTLSLGSGGGYLFGEGGTNTLTGGANAINLLVGGGGGTDTMNGGTGTASNYYFVDGNDQVIGAGAFNTMIELVGSATLQLGSVLYKDVQEFVADGGANAVTVAGGDSDFVYLYGGTGNDTLSTGSGGGYLFGEGGTNTLTGGGGLNVFVADGAAGVDTMNGGSASNIYYIDANSTVNGAGTFNNVIELQQNASLILGSAQLGTDVQQVIFNGGTNSADFHTDTSTVYLYGGSGNDTLFAGAGNDFLYGGVGTNTFKFATGWGQDTIEDWTAGTNSIIDLTGLSSLGVHATTDLTQTISGGNDVITSSHTGTNNITLLGVGTALAAGSFHFA